MNNFSDEELQEVIGDFLEKGLAENIVAMFKKEPELHRLTGDLLKDERFMVRMGVAVLYERLVEGMGLVECQSFFLQHGYPLLTP
ncbi:MAG: hypothetical protein ABFQ82_04890 [Thermodesulfobacteriota bacterium]